MMKKLVLIFLIVYGYSNSSAQENEARAGLLKFAEKKAVINEMRKTATLRIADSLGILLKSETGSSIIELSHFVNGFPRFIGTNNNNAAATTAASAVWPGGAAGLNLTGNGISLGIWDGGRVLTSHQEYSGRASQGDGSVSTSSHATHVGGTMIASGIDPAAKGMSWQANLVSYDWNNDESEMASAAANGLQVSNHSYGYLTGWSNNYRGDGRWVWFGDTTLSITADYGFGAYEYTSHDWDTLAWMAPNYLIVKSSGNDRFEGPVTQPVAHWLWNGGSWVLSSSVRDRDGGVNGYDCIPWQGVAKNILTIGAVNDIPSGYNSPSDVVLAGFSDTGPADDGRIKPDLVANGTSLYSSTSASSTSYTTLTGTSMSTPNASGSIGLLLEHRKNLTGSSTIRAATIKGLLIHTANEAGVNAGPDYNFGWGLIDTRKTALLMSEDAGYGFDFNIRELFLSQGDTIRIPVYASGSQPLVSTISWTDRPSNYFTSYINDPTPVLVNDLDIRIISESNVVSYPWKLDVNNPSAAATSGDNIVDNIEKAEAGTPAAQHTYLLQITHKGTLDMSPQAFSLIISGITMAPASTTWNGSVSGDWHTSGNWSNGIPGAETDVIINDVSTNIPVINASAWCNDLTIGSEGSLTVNEGMKLTVTGDLLIESDSGGTGSYLGGNPDVDGSQEIERYINGFTSAVDGWHLLSSPVSDQPIGDFHTPGSGNDFYRWDENPGLWINRTAPGGGLNELFENNFIPGRGYLVANSNENTSVFSGPFNDDAVSVNGLSRNTDSDYAGWNLAGNPFPCAIAWNDGVNWSVPSEFAGVAKVWDEAGASYTDRGAGDLIPSGNGFMVQLLTGSSSNLSIPLASRVHSILPWFKSTPTRLILTASEKEQLTAQQTVISFSDNATEHYDKEYDSRFLEGYAPKLYSVAGDEYLSTNTLPDFTDIKYIQVGFSGNGASNYSMSMSNLHLDGNTSVFLVDEKEGVVTNLIQSPIYQFTSDEGDNPYRFKLILMHGQQTIPDSKKIFSVYASEGVIYLTSFVNKDMGFRISDAAGRLFLKGHTLGKNLFSVNARNYPNGIYFICFADGSYSQTEKVLLN
ncbi:MAG: S8 family serine peptidase [Bacteroidota bacterium]